MVGVMASWRKKIAGLINSVKYTAEVSSKLDNLQRLRDEISGADSRFLIDFVSPILDLISDSSSPVRKFITQMMGQIGLKHLEFLPEIVPVLITLLKDDSPAVARQAIACGSDIFRCTLVKVAVQGLYSSELNESLRSSWPCVLKFRDEIYSMAFQVGSDGRRLAALKFVESVIVLYTPDPNGSLELPPDQFSQGKFEDFNISWLRGGHPILNAGDLSVEATQNLSLLLDQLRFPTVKSLSNLTIIVLIKSLSAVAKKRPAFYGRILPVLLGLDPSTAASKGMHLPGVHHALKNAFESCLSCTHPGAAPWRDRLVGALKEMKVGSLAAHTLNQRCEDNGRADWKDDSRMVQDEKPSIEELAAKPEHADAGRKRAGVHDSSDEHGDESPGKRARTRVGISEESVHGTSGTQEGAPSSRPITSTSDTDNGPVQQLVAMFGALVAQGEKASASLEILISSISADLLAEVVMANMRNFSPNRPKSEGDEGPIPMMGSHPGMIGSDAHLKNLSSLLTDILSQPGSCPQKDVEVEAHHSLSSGFEIAEGDEDLKSNSEPLVTLADNNVACDGFDIASQQGTVPIIGSASAEHIPPRTESRYAVMTSDALDVGTSVNDIPGLASSAQDDGTVAFSSLESTDVEDTSPEKVNGLGRLSLGSVPSMSTDRSEELSPKAEFMDVVSFNSSPETSVGLPTPLVLPKMSAPVVYLADERKDHLEESAFLRIIDAYKHMAVAGDSKLHLSILVQSGIKFPSDLDLWKPLQRHILSDYVNHEGHELTLRVLYRLHGEAEEDRDFVSSTTVKSVYDMFLLKVAETLRDSFPASEKFLGRLLVEVPYLPKSIFDMLESLCSPGSGDNDDKELHSGDRVTQGLSTIWSLVLLRPSMRDSCLRIALKSATHHLEEVRMKATRLVANKLYPLSSISAKIEDFAQEMLLSVTNVDFTTERSDADGLNTGSQKDGQPSNDNELVSIVKDISTDTDQLTSSESIKSSSIVQVKRLTSLYFALCTKRHSLFRQIFDVYKNMPNVAKQLFMQAVQDQIPLLVRAIGSSRVLFDIISDPPTGSEGLLMQVVHTLTDGTVPSPELISTIRTLYDTKLKDVDILIPILSFMPKHEVLRVFPHLVNAPLDKFHAALSRVLQGSHYSGPALTPEETLIAIHGIDPERDGIPLKKVTDACNACFEQQHIFSQQVLAKVLNQLVEQIPLPLLFMRTVLQTIGAFPSLVDFIMEILSRLVSKQIWKYPKLWVGFVKCAQLTKPKSFSVLLQLPSAQLENALNKVPAVKAPLVAHASQPHIKSSLPRSTLVVLGIASDNQTSSQVPPNQNEAAGDGDAGTSISNRETATESSTAS